MSRVDHWADIRDRSTFRFVNGARTDVPRPSSLKPLPPKPTHLHPKHDLDLRPIPLINGLPAAKEVLEAIAAAYGFSVLELVSHRRTKDVVIARQHAMYEIRERTILSLPQIGKVLGGRDHTTVIHGIKRHEARLASIEANSTANADADAARFGDSNSPLAQRQGHS